VIVDGDCAYFPEEQRATRTAFALPGQLRPSDYGAAMNLGMRRSGTLVYRPLCVGCRRCQPFRVDVDRFTMSRSQKRVHKKADGRFTVDVVRPRVDDEHLALYNRYQADQHGKEGQQGDDDSYARFLVDTVADTWELQWRDNDGVLVGVGVIDVVDDGISSVYFYWEPALRELSLGVFSALWELDLCRRWGKRYYYLGYLVPGSRTMSYKAQFLGGEVWHGDRWQPVSGRDLDDITFRDELTRAEYDSVDADDDNFVLD
ncbi:MAG TPA: arginyltransferase, partial [Myxococcota bacterium]